MPVFHDDCPKDVHPDGHVLFLGNHHPGKGLIEFVRAMKGAHELKAVIAGKEDPKWASYNTRVARELETSGNVRVETGWVSTQRKHELLSGARVVALPYTSAGSGSLVLCEAIGHGRPVVASTVQPLRSLVETAKVGKTVAIEDAAAFGNAIREVAAGPEPFAEGLERARREGAPEAIALRLRTVYEAIAN
jgi:glycosyltransferase involved in cell wall biosynthesis